MGVAMSPVRLQLHFDAGPYKQYADDLALP